MIEHQSDTLPVVGSPIAVSIPWEGGGGYSDIFHIYVGSEHYFGFRKMSFFLGGGGVKKLWIFFFFGGGGSLRNWTILKGHFQTFRAL